MMNTNNVLNKILGKKVIRKDSKSKNNTKYKKLIVNNWFKTYEVLNVSKEVYDNSPNIESAGSAEAIKIRDEAHLKFSVDELKSKGFKKED